MAPDNSARDFELLTIQDCPHGSAARELFARAVGLEGNDPGLVAVRTIMTDQEAEASGFHGSPTFMVDGFDLFPSASEPAMSCRVYRTAGGLSGLPTLESLRQAIRARLAARPQTGTGTAATRG